MKKKFLLWLAERIMKKYNVKAFLGTGSVFRFFGTDFRIRKASIHHSIDSLTRIEIEADDWFDFRIDKKVK
jgi:hypothetical protein